MVGVSFFEGKWKSWLVYTAVISNFKKTKEGGWEFTLDGLVSTTGFPYDILVEGLKEIESGRVRGLLITENKSVYLLNEVKPEELSCGKPKTENEKKLFRMFTDLWVAEYEKFWGAKYNFQNVIDGKAVKKLLKINHPEELIKIAKRAWELSKLNLFYCKKSYTIAGFLGSYNQINAEIKNAEARTRPNPFLRLKAIDELLESHPCNPNSMNYKHDFSKAQYDEYSNLKKERVNILKEIAKC